ncbi:YhgE/Pip domain-containing protein [Bacillus sp. BGMRC 2118]|nr:YhgE/Pip domain-containing protein [Bacillus sp. BGMRC 2118]
MKGSSFKAEIKQILSNRKVLIPILAVAFVPVLYAGMFLWAFWNPYDMMSDLPVAIVNEDKGAESDGKQLQLGQDLVDNLTESNTFKFSSVSKEEGYSGLENQDYYILVEIPENFSSNATTLLDDKPEKLQIKYVPNEGSNFLSGQIGETAMKEIRAEISKKIISTYAETMFENVTDMADGLEQASDGAGQLNDGAIVLSNGTKALKENLELLASKSIEFNEGMTEATKGSADLSTGTDAVKKGLGEIDSKLPALVQGTQDATDGIQQMKVQLPKQIAESMSKRLSGSVNQLNAGVDQFQTKLGDGLSTGLTEGISSGLSEQLATQLIAQETAKMQSLAQTLLQNGVPDATVQQIMSEMGQTAPTKDQLQKQLQQQLMTNLQPQIQQGIDAGLEHGFSQFKTELSDQLTGSTTGMEDQLRAQTSPVFDQLLTGMEKIQQGQVGLQQGIDQLYEGSIDLNRGALELTTGMNQLSTGAGQIQEGTGKLSDGSNQVNEGTEKIMVGSDELSSKLADGAKEASSVTADKDTYDMMGEPVTITKDEINSVPNYGTGFAPYFISLGLFVGALLISIVFSLKEPAVRPNSGLQWFLSKFGVIAVVGVIQAILVDVILLVGLKIEVASLPMFFLTSIITSFVFMALVQMLVSMLCDPGRFLAIIILILQLTTSAGTFPLELIPHALQPINTFLPMTYSVQAFKAVISSGDMTYMWQNNVILLTYMIGFMLVTVSYFTMKLKRDKTISTNENVVL